VSTGFLKNEKETENIGKYRKNKDFFFDKLHFCAKIVCKMVFAKVAFALDYHAKKLCFITFCRAFCGRAASCQKKSFILWLKFIRKGDILKYITNYDGEFL